MPIPAPLHPVKYQQVFAVAVIGALVPQSNVPLPVTTPPSGGLAFTVRAY